MAENSGRTAKAVRGRPFQAGQSGNPGGRPKSSASLRRLAGEFTQEAVGVLVNVMREGGERARVAAASALLDRAHGRAPMVDVPAEIQRELDALMGVLERLLPPDHFERVLEGLVEAAGLGEFSASVDASMDALGDGEPVERSSEEGSEVPQGPG